jgi:hypothetical protein
MADAANEDSPVQRHCTRAVKGQANGDVALAAPRLCA